MNRKRRKVRPLGVAVLVLMVLVPVLLVTLVVYGIRKDRTESAPGNAETEATESATEEIAVPATQKAVTDPKPTEDTQTRETMTAEKETRETEATEQAPQAEPEPTWPEVSTTVDDVTSSTALAIAELARKQIGKPYSHGGTGPNSFDNSGFVCYVCRANGVDIPRGAGGMLNCGTAVSREKLKAGDIVIFSNNLGGKGDFVGIYLGEGQFAACFNENDGTKTESMDNKYWSPRFVTGRRVM